MNPPGHRRALPVVWSLDDARAFLDAVAGDSLEAVHVLAIATLIRIGEVLGIHCEDVDGAGDVIHVRHAFQTQRDRGLVVVELKTQTSRQTVPVPPFAIEALREYVDGWGRSQGLVFTTRSGRPISPRDVVRDFHEALERAGLPRIRSHDLRHYCAPLHLNASAIHAPSLTNAGPPCRVHQEP